jgi:hypothetical protein
MARAECLQRGDAALDEFVIIALGPDEAGAGRLGKSNVNRAPGTVVA